MNVHFSSRDPGWGTPVDLYERLNAEFGFTLDVCTTPDNPLGTPHFFTPEEDGLGRDWAGHICWMNPPYGRAIRAWTRKAAGLPPHGFVVALLPARTDTAWWHDDVMRASEIRLVRGRIRFVGARSAAPFPSAIVIFAGRTSAPRFRSYRP